MIKKILKEPLTHFILIGAFLFIIYSPDKTENNPKKIVVTKDRIHQLKESFEKKWRRPPSKRDLARLLDEYLKEEVFYREGMALRLGEDDTIIRRRVAQKYQFLIEDLSSGINPSEKELKDYFKKNSKRFSIPKKLAFTHVYFSIDKRGKEAFRAAKAAMLEKDPAKFGDVTSLPSSYPIGTEKDIAREFGFKFAESLFKVELHRWQGPIKSGFGLHLVRVNEIVKEIIPEFSRVAEKVRKDYIDEIRCLKNKKLIKGIRDQYAIKLENDQVLPQIKYEENLCQL